MGFFEKLGEGLAHVVGGLADTPEYRAKYAARMAEYDAAIEERRRKEREAKHRRDMQKNGPAALQSFVEQAQREIDARTKRERRNGHNVRQTPLVVAGMFDGELAIAKSFEGGNRNRMEIYYGGTGDNPLANDNHGHVILEILGRGEYSVEEWLLPAATKEERPSLAEGEW